MEEIIPWPVKKYDVQIVIGAAETKNYQFGSIFCCCQKSMPNGKNIEPKTSFQLLTMGKAIFTPLYEVATANQMIDKNTQ